MEFFLNRHAETEEAAEQRARKEYRQMQKEWMKWEERRSAEELELRKKADARHEAFQSSLLKTMETLVQSFARPSAPVPFPAPTPNFSTSQYRPEFHAAPPRPAPPRPASQSPSAGNYHPMSTAASHSPSASNYHPMSPPASHSPSTSNYHPMSPPTAHSPSSDYHPMSPSAEHHTSQQKDQTDNLMNMDYLYLCN